MKKFFVILSLAITGTGLMAQTKDAGQQTSPADSLLNSISNDTKNGPVTIFKSSRLILTQTTETVKKHNLNFLIIHRFGDFAGKNGGGQFYYGLDDISDVYLGFEYGVTDNLNVDIGRSTIGGLADLELKYAVLHQTTNGSSPLAITVLGEGALRPYGFVAYPTFGDRASYLAQVMIARKFSPGLSFQLTPTIVSNNSTVPLVPGSEERFFALAATARLKVTNHMGLIIDYAHPFSSFRNTANGFYDPLGVGIEIETGGHVFTINLTNARAVSEINYLNDTQSNFTKGQFRIGFTISRMFDLNSRKKENH
jgi:hypothetical protein